MRETDTTILKRRLGDLTWAWIVAHWWKLLIGIGGFIAGVVVAYVGIYVQLSDARHAGEDAKAAVERLERDIEKLATRDQLEAEKERIDRLEKNWDDATQQAGTAPLPRRRRDGL
jgi:hypothetical protein